MNTVLDPMNNDDPIIDEPIIYNETDYKDDPSYTCTNILLYSFAGGLCIYSMRSVLRGISQYCINMIHTRRRKIQINEYLLSRETHDIEGVLVDNVNECLDKYPDECSICLESLSPPQMIIRLPCNHTFHSKCILLWFEKELICPNCRAPIMF
jgi:hypothetical protein